MRIKYYILNSSQKKELSTFFNNIAVAYFIGIFVVPQLSLEFDILDVIRYIILGIFSLFIALLFLQEES